MHRNSEVLSLIHSDLHCSQLVPECTAVLHVSIAPAAVQMLDWWWWQDTGWWHPPVPQHGTVTPPLSPAATVHLLKRPRFTPQHCFLFSQPQMFAFPTLFPFLFFDHLNSQLCYVKGAFQIQAILYNPSQFWWIWRMSTPPISNNWEMKVSNIFCENYFAVLLQSSSSSRLVCQFDYSKGTATPPSQANS